jgi:hypothetical protein
LTPYDHAREAKLAIGFAHRFKCQHIVHDWGGAGQVRETIIVQSGYPLERVLPIAYVRFGATSAIMQYKPGTKGMPRSHYQVDKTRSLLTTIHMIKTQWIRFFKDDFVSKEDQGLLRDFLALVDEIVDSRQGRNLYTIIRDPTRPDDFAQAVNIGCCALWKTTERWPNIAAIAGLQVPEDLLNSIHPQN